MLEILLNCKFNKSFIDNINPEKHFEVQLLTPALTISHLYCP